ncbi:MAG TPA: 5'(3')-deoxyribonucleotidase [Chitinophagaceae bacterium]
MERLAVDMDGVLADVYEQFFRYDEKDFGKRRSLESVTGVEERSAFPHINEYVYAKGFFRTAPVVKDSVKIVAELNKNYELFIVSAAMEFPQSLPEKFDWLNEHFSFLTWQQIVFCGSKTIIDADIMIDDHFKNLDLFKGTTILFTQPHNQLKNSGRHKRTDSWQEIASILL